MGRTQGVFSERHDSTGFQAGEDMRRHFKRIAQIAQQFLFFGVNGNSGRRV